MAVLSFRFLNPLQPGPFVQYLLPDALDGAQSAADGPSLLGAVLDRSACGAAAVHWHDGWGELRSLFIDPAVRSQGAAGRMVDLLLEEAAKRDAVSLSASYILRGEELAAMDALFLRRGGTPQPVAPVFSVDSASQHDSRILGAAFRPGFQPDSHIRPFSALSSEQLTALEDDPDIPDFLLPSACARRMDSGLSVAWLEQDRIQSYLLGGSSSQADFQLLAAWRKPQTPPQSVFHLLRAQVNLCYYRCGGDFQYFFSALTQESETLARRMLGESFTLYEEHEVLLPVPGAGEQADSQSPSPDPADSE